MILLPPNSSGCFANLWCSAGCINIIRLFTADDKGHIYQCDEFTLLRSRRGLRLSTTGMRFVISCKRSRLLLVFRNNGRGLNIRSSIVNELWWPFVWNDASKRNRQCKFESKHDFVILSINWETKCHISESELKSTYGKKKSELKSLLINDTFWSNKLGGICKTSKIIHVLEEKFAIMSS